MCSSLNIAFNLKQNTYHYIAENDVRLTIDLKIICLARVRFEFETPVLYGTLSMCSGININPLKPKLV
jgi:hypothetical protein